MSKQTNPSMKWEAGLRGDHIAHKVKPAFNKYSKDKKMPRKDNYKEFSNKK